MKKIFLILLAVASSLPLLAQGTGDAAVLERLARKSAGLESFSASFVQTARSPMLKEPVVSKGEMQYRKDGRIMWRVTSPGSFQLGLTNDNIVITRGGTSETISYSDNPLYLQVKNLLMGLMSGEQLSGGGRFELSLTTGKEGTSVTMVPVQRQLKKMFSSFVISFTPDDIVKQVVMNESDGGSTTIVFDDRKVK